MEGDGRASDGVDTRLICQAARFKGSAGLLLQSSSSYYHTTGRARGFQTERAQALVEY